MRSISPGEAPSIAGPFNVNRVGHAQQQQTNQVKKTVTARQE